MEMRFVALRAALLATVGLGVTACSSIVEGSSQDIAINTEPPGAACKVERAGLVVGSVARTPGSVKIDKTSQGLAVVCTREGYAETRRYVDSEIAAMTFGNILAGGFIGIGIDAATGALHKYDSSVMVTMQPASGESAPSAPVARASTPSLAVTSEPVVAAASADAVPAAPIVAKPAPRQGSAPAAAPTTAATPTGPIPLRYEMTVLRTFPGQSNVSPFGARDATSEQQTNPAPSPGGTRSAPARGPSGGNGGPWRAHLASHRTEAAAMAEWDSLVKTNAALYGTLKPAIVWADLAERGRFARLTVGEYASQKEAADACASLRGPGRYCAPIRAN